jgi:phospholipid/cholesterol/gamma-HCH transport system substrate-binding protein
MSSQVKVGLTVILAIVLFYFGLAWANGSGFWQKERNSYVIAFEEVDGLMEGDPVDIRGYVSGRVQGIEPGTDFVWVNIALDKDVKLYSGATAEIRVKEILGGKQIAIIPSAKGQILQHEDTLRGRSSLDFSSAFSTVGKVVEDIDGDLIRAFLERFDTLTAQFGRLTQAVDPAKIQLITDNLLETTTDIRLSIKDVSNRDMIDRLDTALNQFSLLAQTADASFNQINTMAVNIEQTTLPKADSMLQKLFVMLDHTDNILSAATELLDDVQNPNTALGYLINDPQGGPLLDSTLHNLNRTLDHIRTKKLHVAMSLRHKKRTFEE